MRKQKLYLDTSIISHLSARDTPEKMADTIKFWEILTKGEYEVFISSIVFDELARCPEPKRSLLMDSMLQISYVEIQDSDDVIDLAKKFIDFGILREKSIDDCRHIASAIISGCDMIISWNFKHIVNPRTMRGVKSITIGEGFKDLLICTPTMIIEGDSFNE